MGTARNVGIEPDPIAPQRRGEPVAPARSAGWAARQLGISPATLRTWHHRYGVAPTERTPGGHRRYAAADIERLRRMRTLVLNGVPVAEAARRSEPEVARSAVRPRRGGGRVLPAATATVQVRALSGAAMALDQPAVSATVDAALRAHGVVSTWTELVMPVLQSLGTRFERHGDCIDAEHLFSESVRAALVTVWRRPRRWLDRPPVLLAAVADEQHTLPLHALAAALAEQGTPSRLMGAAVPAPTLAAAVRRIGPSAMFLWARMPGAGRLAEVESLPRSRPPVCLVIGGNGWPDGATTAVRASTLEEAVAALAPTP